MAKMDFIVGSWDLCGFNEGGYGFGAPRQAGKFHQHVKISRQHRTIDSDMVSAGGNRVKSAAYNGNGSGRNVAEAPSAGSLRSLRTEAGDDPCGHQGDGGEASKVGDAFHQP